ncbi:MAG: hypothetical protein ACM30E_03855 [Nitrososphaerales archaeon]
MHRSRFRRFAVVALVTLVALLLTLTTGAAGSSARATVASAWPDAAYTVLLPFVTQSEVPLAYRLIPESVTCAPNAGISYYNGVVRDRAGNLQNGVCVHIAFYGPRQTKCSGCGGVGDGNWGFAPFGAAPAPANTPVEIFIVACPPDIPPEGQNSDFGELTPLSDKWLYTTTTTSMQCTGITFQQN